jgi:hypothetical protein
MGQHILSEIEFDGNGKLGYIKGRRDAEGTYFAPFAVNN